MCCCQTPPVQTGTYCPGSGHGVYKRTSSDGTGSRRNTKAELFPLAELITPNIPEAEVLTGLLINDDSSMEHACRELFARFHCAILLKSGHRTDHANDLLYTGDETLWIKGERIDNPNSHGTGCTLSSTIAANLAKGYSLGDAVAKAKEYLTEALRVNLDLGNGHGPVDHALGGQHTSYFYN